MKNDKLAIIGTLLISIFGIIVVVIVTMLEKDRLNKKITKLESKNSKLIVELNQKKKDNQMMGLAIESLLEQVEGKKQVECDYEWLEDFYYDHVCDDDGCEVRE